MNLKRIFCKETTQNLFLQNVYKSLENRQQIYVGSNDLFNFNLSVLPKQTFLKAFSVQSQATNFFFFQVWQMKLKNHSQRSNPTKVQLIQSAPLGRGSRGAAQAVSVLSAIPTPCTATRSS